LVVHQRDPRPYLNLKKVHYFLKKNIIKILVKIKNKTYIIAEVGANHNGSFSLAKKYIDKLSKFDIDAVKFQLGNPCEVFSKVAFVADYHKKSKGYKSNQNLIVEDKKRQLSCDEHLKISNYCKKKNIDYLCSSFDLKSLKFLIDTIKVNKIKIPSGEIFSLDLLNYLNKSKKNFEIILSTGMANYNEIKTCLKFLKNIPRNRIKLLHCISNYPTKINVVNLLSIPEMKKIFKCEIGFSDHTTNNLTSCIAVSLGAKIIEKHVTFNKNLSGPDHRMSLSISEFKNLVLQIRAVEKMLGNKSKPISKEEIKIAKVARKSIVANKDLLIGTKITLNDISFKRPGTGILPIYYKKILNKKIKKFIPANTIILKKNIL